MATETANKQYKYDQIVKGKTIDEWVQFAHKQNCRLNGWNYYPLKKGAFGYDNLAVCIGYILNNISTIDLFNMNMDVLAEKIHEGWVINYTYWRDNKPYERFPELYFKPFNPIGDEKRNTSAITQYNNLPLEEKEKDIIIAKIIYDEYFV